MRANIDIRQCAKNNGVRFWEICEVLKISEPTMTRRLRKELSEKDKAAIVEIIKKISSTRNETHTLNDGSI